MDKVGEPLKERKSSNLDIPLLLLQSLQELLFSLKISSLSKLRLFPFIVPRLTFLKAQNPIGLEQSLGRRSCCDVRALTSQREDVCCSVIHNHIATCECHITTLMRFFFNIFTLTSRRQYSNVATCGGVFQNSPFFLSFFASKNLIS